MVLRGDHCCQPPHRADQGSDGAPRQKKHCFRVDQLQVGGERSQEGARRSQVEITVDKAALRHTRTVQVWSEWYLPMLYMHNIMLMPLNQDFYVYHNFGSHGRILKVGLFRC